MALRFILGRAGSGKTWTCLEEIKSELRRSPDGPALVFVVPEQASFQMERALFGAGDPAGAMRAQVLSFHRLAWRVLGETGGAARPHLDDLGKRLVLRAILERRKDGLEVFGRPAGQAGFVEKLTAALKELNFYRIEPDDLLGGAEALARRGLDRSTLACKLRDLAQVAGDLREYLKDKYTDPDDYLSLLAARLPSSPTVRGAMVYVDGFAGFTPQEYVVLEALMKTAAEVNVALCLDPAEVGRPPEEIDLFHSTRDTHRRLSDAAARAGVEVRSAVVLPGDGRPTRFSGSPALAHLERQFTRPDTRAFPGDPAPAVTLVAAGDRRAEVDAAAREVIRLCRDHGYRYRDVAVVVRDLEPYEALITSVFGDYGLPFFIDRRRPASHHPLVEFVRSILETAVTDWAADPLFRALKTDLLPFDREDVDRLENYVLAHGIRGRVWSDGRAWSFRRGTFETESGEPSLGEREELERVNRTREKVIRLVGGPVRDLRAAIASPAPARRLAEVLFGLIESLDIAETLAAWSDEATRSCGPAGARQHEQVWNGFAGLLDRLVEALGEQPMTLSEFAGILESGLEALRLGLIPPSLDQVLVGAVDRSRQPELRAILVLGVNDGSFPAAVAEDTVFTDQERDDLLAEGLELGPPARLRSFHEEYLGYIALTRARERLYVSYPLADQEGKPLASSPLVARMRLCLPGLRTVAAGLDPGDEPVRAIDHLTDTRRAALHLVRRLAAARGGRRPSPFWFQVYRALASHPDRRAQALVAARALVFANDAGPLPGDLVQRLYGEPLRSSVTRLERFAACPFKHFLADGLLLRERGVHRVEAPDVGSLFHQALQLFVGRAVDAGVDLAVMSEAEMEAVVAKVVDEVTPRLRDQILLSSARYRYVGRLLRRTLRRTAGAILQHARRGQFKPAGVEVRFGFGGQWPPLAVDLNPGRLVEVRGQIDRVDVAEAGGRRFLRVVDYKSGRKDLKVEDLYYGLSLQLLVYLAVAMENLPGAEPAGLMYLRVHDPVLRVDGPLPDDQREDKKLRQMRAGGMFLADSDAVRLMDAGATGYSAIVPLRINNDGAVGKTKAAIDADQMRALLGFARKRVKSLGQRIAGGEIRVAPYRRGTERPCAYCEFRAACGFDILLPGNDYRRLGGDHDEIWCRLAAGDLGDGPDDGPAGGETV